MARLPFLHDHDRLVRRHRHGPGAEHPSVGGYEVLALLRAGDAGPLYRVRDAALGRDLMFEEFLPPALAARDAAGQVRPALPAAAPVLDRARRRFVDESRVLAGHEHPHLARVLHIIEAGGTVCRAMPGYPGGRCRTCWPKARPRAKRRTSAACSPT